MVRWQQVIGKIIIEFTLN